MKRDGWVKREMHQQITIRIYDRNEGNGQERKEVLNKDWWWEGGMKFRGKLTGQGIACAIVKGWNVNMKLAFHCVCVFKICFSVSTPVRWRG